MSIAAPVADPTLAKAKAPKAVSPAKLSHVVLKTSRFSQMTAWYKTVLDARFTLENDIITTLTYDDEHHRVAIINVPDLRDLPQGHVGLHHFSFTYGSLLDLLQTHARLKAEGIDNASAMNHGPTTSIYYHDPDGNLLELQVDNFETEDEVHAFMSSPAFAKNPIGVEVDPEDLMVRLMSGESERDLKARIEGEPPDMAEVERRLSARAS